MILLWKKGGNRHMAPTQHSSGLPCSQLSWFSDGLTIWSEIAYFCKLHLTDWDLLACLWFT